MTEGLAGSDEYLNQWYWTGKLERDGSAEEILETVSRELVEKWDPKIQAK